jgi:hypothetical protein
MLVPNDLRFPNVLGSVPFKLFCETFKVVTAVNDPTSLGSVPVRKLLPTWKLCKAVTFQMLVGMGPTMKLLDISNETRFANSPMVLGSALEMKLFAKLKDANKRKKCNPHERLHHQRHMTINAVVNTFPH